MEFTDTSVRVPAATMMIFGSPATLSGGTQRDNSVRINVAGRVNMENVQRSAANVPFGQSLRGSTDWKTTITLRKRVADILFESTLQGIASDLPPPFGKAAADALPLKLERIVTGAQQDQINVALGSIVSAQLQRRRENGQLAVDRGTVTLGGGVAAEPERKGVYITGGLKSFNFDHWLAISKAALGDTGQGQLAGIDVKFGTLDVFGRRFNDLAISGSAQAGVWQMTLVGRELVGEMTWRSQGKGKVTARMKNLVIPSASPERPPPSIDKEAPLELPALDIYADNFQVRQASLGKLELTAVLDGRDWRLGIGKVQRLEDDQSPARARQRAHPLRRPGNTQLQTGGASPPHGLRNPVDRAVSALDGRAEHRDGA